MHGPSHHIASGDSLHSAYPSQHSSVAQQQLGQHHKAFLGGDKQHSSTRGENQ